ncbi:MAG: HD domain-containing protein [Spirochaetaceae bacterium]|nr:HD domain-containing protein [Spirochaetaceae bacterium]
MSALVDPTLASELAGGTPSQRVDTLFAYMRRRGQSFYDESVTQLEHALQCAHQAELAAADPVQVAAALLHDLGHFLVDEHDDQADFLTEDLLHEEIGATYLQPFFIERLTEPVRLHVPAKRYLCTTDSAYHDGLSRASKRSFQLQGGPMSAAEQAEFERNPHARDAVRLRRWDDLAKVKGLATAGLERYRDAVRSCLR